MPPNSYDNLLPIEIFRRKLAYNPFEFWQLASAKTPLTSSSKTLLKEYAWQQGNSAGREDIRQAINSAETKLRQQLNFDVALKYRQQVWDLNDPKFQWQRQIVGNPFGANFPSFGYGVGGYGYGYGGFATTTPGFILPLDVCKINRVGTLNYTKIDDVTITLEDADGDGIKERFYFEYADSGTLDPNQLVVAFAEAERTYSDEADKLANWFVRPVRAVRKDANTIKVLGAAWLIVKPELYEGVRTPPGYTGGSTGINSSGAYDTEVTTNFASTLTLYKKVWSAENQATVNVYRRSDGTLLNSYTVPTFFNDIQGRQLGFLCLTWYDFLNAVNACQATWQNVESGVNVVLSINYEAGAGYKKGGYDTSYGQFDPEEMLDWQTSVYRFACAELAKSIGGSEEANRETAKWQRNLATTIQGENAFRVPDGYLTCPWGTTAGAVDAWQMVKDMTVQRSVGGLT